VEVVVLTVLAHYQLHAVEMLEAALRSDPYDYNVVWLSQRNVSRESGRYSRNQVKATVICPKNDPF
jgi:hypothetical protein